MVTFTFIRHGQSTDNVVSYATFLHFLQFASDAEDVEKSLGRLEGCSAVESWHETTSLGKWFSDNDVHFTAILSSNLDRAATTAETILNHQSEPHPPHVKSLLLREQYFGIAEGKPWSKRLNNGLSVEEHYEQGIFPHLPRRSDRFPGGESRDDLAARAERAIDELLMPHILSTEEQEYVHIAVISHGLFIREIVNALYRREFGKERLLENYRGLSNTGWTSVIVQVKNPQNSLKSISPLKLDLSVRITDFDKHEHLNKLVRQRGGIGSLAHDPKQKDIRGFFAGATSKS